MPINYIQNAIEPLKSNLIRSVPEKFKEESITNFLYSDLKEALSSLSQRNYEIIEKRYGLCNNAQSLEKIGSKYKLSKERIRQLEKEILDHLCTSLIRKNWKIKYGEDNPELPIEISELSHRTKTALVRNEINTIEKLSLCTPSEILSIKNIGIKSIEEIEEYLLNQFGIKL